MEGVEPLNFFFPTPMGIFQQRRCIYTARKHTAIQSAKRPSHSANHCGLQPRRAAEFVLCYIMLFRVPTNALHVYAQRGV